MARMPDTLEITAPDGQVIRVGIRTTTSTVHHCPSAGSNLTPCCDRTPFELPRTDRITVEPDLVTCHKGGHR